MIKNILRNGLLMLSIGLMVGCSSSNDEKNSISIKDNILVETTPAKIVEYAEEIKATGRLAFHNEYKMSFKTGGVIEEIYAKEGQKITKGKVLASLKLEEINAKTSQAKISLDKAKRDYERAKALYADSVVTLEQLQNAETQFQNAEQTLRTAQFNQSHSKIIAPTNGIIQKILVKENEITGAGNPIIIFGSENQGRVLAVNVSDIDVVKINIGDKSTLHFDAWPEKVFDGKVLEISEMANPSTGTYEVKIQVNDTDNKLKTGFIGSAVVTSSKVNQWIEVPIESLIKASEKTGVVYKVEKGVALQQEVQIVHILNNKLLLSSGISENDNIIIKGFSKLKVDKVSVKIVH